MTPSGAYRHAHVAQGPFFHPKDAMRYHCDISGAWTTFVLDKSEGFTQAGMERLNDSICNPGSASPDAVEYAQDRDKIWRPETISGLYRRRDCLAR